MRKAESTVREIARGENRNVDFSIQGKQGLDNGLCVSWARVRKTTGMTSKTRAKEVEDKRKNDLRNGNVGIRRQQSPRLLSVAAEAWLAMKKATLAPRSVMIEKANLAHLLPKLGRKLVCDIEARDIALYQQDRLEEVASPKTVNLEIGTLRGILKRSGQCARLQPDVNMLATQDDIGRAFTSAEESALLQACGKSRSRSLVPFVTLAIETGARRGVIQSLQCGNVDFENRCIKWGKDKTSPGTGRVIPLSQRAMSALSFWATHFPERKPEHYVIPAERYSAGGDKFSAEAYDIDHTKPMGSAKEAWEAAKLRAGKILNENRPEKDKVKKEKDILALVCRFHDLRHTAVSRMLNARIPIAKVAKIAGWSPATMVRMAAGTATSH